MEVAGPNIAVCYHIFQVLPPEQRAQLLRDAAEWDETCKAEGR